MNMWECLGIEKTKDINRIKSAYAKLLRVHHPEDDPEGFQMLKAAYEFAQNYVRIEKGDDAYKEELLLEMGFVRYWQQNSLDATDGPDKDKWVTGVLDDLPDSKTTSSLTISNDDFAPDRELLDDYIERMLSLYGDFFARCETANWENLLKHDLLWNIDSKKRLEPMIQKFLILHRNLPPEVWTIFDNEFYWTDRIREISRSNPPFVQVILVETCKRWTLDYSFIKADAAYDYEKYTDFLRLTREAALENDTEKTNKYFLMAIGIYEKESQIYRIIVEFLETQSPYSSFGKFRPAYRKALDQLLELHANDYLYLLMRADLNKKCEDFEKARKDFLQIMKICPENLSFPLEIALSYRKQSMDTEAKSCLKYIRKNYPETKRKLELQLETTEDKVKIRKVMESNDRIIEQVRDALKFRFDPYRHGPVLYIVSCIVIFTILTILMMAL